MQKDTFRILSFLSAGKFADPAGKRLAMTDRPFSSFLFLLSGTIRFTGKDGTVVYADRETPVYLPRGACYLNECLEEAHSLMFTFEDNQSDPTLCAFARVEPDLVREIYEKTEHAAAARGKGAELEILGRLYLLADRLFSGGGENENPLFLSAVDLMLKRISDPTLTVRQIASSLFVSEVYLRRVFLSVCGSPPAAYLTALRMNRAREYLAGRRSVTETAEAVGYSGIYSFSRSYKRFFGVAPTSGNAVSGGKE